MSLAVLVCEERFRADLEPLVAESGYRLLRDEDPVGLYDASPSGADVAAVVSAASGRSQLRALDQQGIRYWLVTVGSPWGPDFPPPSRQPHRRLLSLDSGQAAYLLQLLDDWRDRDLVRVDCFTFGFRDGLPAEADWVVDTRFLDSPYWIPEMRDLPGSDPRVRAHLMAQAGARQLVDNFLPMLLELLPLYQAQRRSVLRLAVGCTGGKHRSVAIASEIVDRINRSGRAAARHLDRPPLSVPQALD